MANSPRGSDSMLAREVAEHRNDGCRDHDGARRPDRARRLPPLPAACDPYAARSESHDAERDELDRQIEHRGSAERKQDRERHSREEFFTSPLGTVAPSMPENAKIMMPAVPSTVLMSGTSASRRDWHGSTKNTPMPTNSEQRQQLAAVVIASSTRAPLRTPRMLIATSVATTAHDQHAATTQTAGYALNSANSERDEAIEDGRRPRTSRS